MKTIDKASLTRIEDIVLRREDLNVHDIVFLDLIKVYIKQKDILYKTEFTKQLNRALEAHIDQKTACRFAFWMCAKTDIRSDPYQKIVKIYIKETFKQ